MLSKLNSANVCVTGGSGMVGQELLGLLAGNCANLKSVDLNRPEKQLDGVEYSKLDLRNFEDCKREFSGFDYVINSAGIKGSPDACKAYPSKFFVPMVQMNTNAMEASRNVGVTGFVYISSVGVYEPAQKFEEKAMWDGFPSANDWYGGWAKRVGEIQAQSYIDEGNWSNVHVIRPANVYGKNDNFDPQGAMVVPSLIRRAFEAESSLTVFGDGTPVRDFVHASDVARAALFVIENNVTEPMNVGSGVGYTIKELAEAVISASGKSLRLEWTEAKSAGDNIRLMDMSFAHSLGFKSTKTLRDGISETYNWFANNASASLNRFNAFS